MTMKSSLKEKDVFLGQWPLSSQFVSTSYILETDIDVTTKSSLEEKGSESSLVGGVFSSKASLHEIRKNHLHIVVCISVCVHLELRMFI